MSLQNQQIQQPLLTASNITLTAGGEILLENTSFTISTGEIVALVGPNGAGKSLLIKALLGLYPVIGTICFWGKGYIPYKKIGYVPQYFVFDRTIPLTVDEFLRLSCRCATPQEHSHRVLAEVGLPQKIYFPLGKLSGGELQRVLLARAILGDPQFLILDEATANVDVVAQRSIHDVLQHLNVSHSTTILFVSHDSHDVQDLATATLTIANRTIVRAAVSSCKK